MNAGERARQARESADRAAETLALIRRERDLLHIAGHDTALLDTVLAELEELTAAAADVAVMAAVRAAITTHGPGPHRPADLAELTGYDLPAIRRALREIGAPSHPEPPAPQLG